MDRKVTIAIVAVVIVVVAVFAAAAAIGNKPATDSNVTYHANGGHAIGVETDTSDFTSSSATALDEHYEKGYEAQFDWNTRADGTGDFVSPGEKIPSGVKDLYAWFSPYISVGYSSKSYTDHVGDVTVTISGTYRGDSGYSFEIGKYNSPTYDKVAIPSDAKITVKDASATSVELTWYDDNNGSFVFSYADKDVKLSLDFHKSSDMDVGCCTTTNFVADPANHCGYVTFTPMDDCIKCLSLFAETPTK